MIILDTNVISEVMKGARASAQVRLWLARLREIPVTTVINRAEILAGIEALDDGARRDTLRSAAQSAFTGLGVCLPLTQECTSHYAHIRETRRAQGRPVGGFDALIAAIARETNSSVATRDLSDFDGLGMDLVDPWSD